MIFFSFFASCEPLRTVNGYRVTTLEGNLWLLTLERIALICLSMSNREVGYNYRSKGIFYKAELVKVWYNHESYSLRG